MLEDWWIQINVVIKKKRGTFFLSGSHHLSKVKEEENTEFQQKLNGFPADAVEKEQMRVMLITPGIYYKKIISTSTKNVVK